MLERAIAAAFGILDRGEQGQLACEHARVLIGELTKRERGTMAILIDGVPNKEAAYRLGLSIRTVEMYRGNAMSKLKAKSIAEVVMLASFGGFGPEMKLPPRLVEASEMMSSVGLCPA